MYSNVACCILYDIRELKQSRFRGTLINWRWGLFLINSLDAAKFVLLSLFTLTYCRHRPENLGKTMPSKVKSPLSVDVRRSETSLLKLPNNYFWKAVNFKHRSLAIRILFTNYHQPKGNLSGLMSIPIILAAPAALQPITAESPTPPSPHTATLDPGFT